MIKIKEDDHLKGNFYCLSYKLGRVPNSIIRCVVVVMFIFNIFMHMSFNYYTKLFTYIIKINYNLFISFFTLTGRDME